jgi:hypothetical protein
MNSDKYILRPHGIIVRADSLKQWAEWLENSKNRKIDRTKVGDVSISTIFLSLDHRNEGDPSPILFETMVFGGPHDQHQERCSTLQEAKEMHARIVALVEGTEK